MSKRGRRLAPVGTPGITRRQAPPLTDRDFHFDYALNLIYSLDENDLEQRLKHLDSLGEIGNARRILLDLIRNEDDRRRKALAAALMDIDLNVDKLWPKLETNAQKINYLLKLVHLPVPADSAHNLIPRKSIECDRLAADFEAQQRDLKRRFKNRLLPLLKEEIQSRSVDSYEEKLELVRWLNAELKRFDFAIKSPKTGQSGVLKAKQGNNSEIGTFQIISDDTDGREKTFSTPDKDVLSKSIDLIEAPPRREALAEWRAKVGQQTKAGEVIR